MKLANVTAIVKMILETVPATRDDDDLLWIKVLEKVAAYSHLPDFSKTMPFRDFLFVSRTMNLPHFKTVSRTRRKLQEEYPELRGSAETQAARAELEEAYREFARNY